MRAYVQTDLEGVAGVVSFEKQGYADGIYYEAARRLLTAEINAAVEGLVACGIDDVLVADSHGPGAVYFEDLLPPAKLMHGRPWPGRAVRDQILKDYDVTIMIGQHAMAGVRDGTLNHTQSSRAIDYIKLNGKPIGEIAQWGLYAGSFGIPLIFLSGDEAACREMEELVPGIVTAAVKKGLGRQAAVSLSAPEAHRLIREGVKKAVQNHVKHPVAPVAWDGPYVLEKRYFHTHVADSAAEPGTPERVDSQTVRFHSDDIRRIVYR